MSGLESNSRSITTTGERMAGGDVTELATDKASMFRALVARANYLSQDRGDIKYAVKELSRRMAKPRVKDIEQMKKLARYLKGNPRVIQVFKPQPMPKRINIWSDSDYAGCLETRKSTSGGVIQLGEHVTKIWSSTQNVIALSSGEAEYYALVKAGSQGLGFQAMLRDLGMEGKLVLKGDATAAKGIALRKGLGTVRHIEVNQLWLQDKINKSEFEIHKVKGTENLADALTKYLSGKDTREHLEWTGMENRDGRHPMAPQTEIGE